MVNAMRVTWSDVRRMVVVVFLVESTIPMMMAVAANWASPEGLEAMWWFSKAVFVPFYAPMAMAAMWISWRHRGRI